MKPVVLDCIGLSCPQPVLRVKEALEQGVTCIEVLVDNEASRNNVSRFAQSQGHAVACANRPGGGFALTITATAGQSAQSVGAEEYRCTIPTAPKLIYVIASDTMGRGSDELGWALMQTYIQTIKDVSPLPEKIIFYNSGVKLVAAASGGLDALKRLQDLGVEILACGTCLDFFKLKSAIQVGHISNMHEIMQAMTAADKILSPY
ncbi:selenium metabolism protein YedF [Desulfobulbus propionicus DSM 2032]|jgi:selenium metabolism protein YedF|uniref:Selenium metabolism protein YedF n=1 Tax=Desulfobulbus propionicus (strain ATCC 33891 / DSM 2032 / VKM B-1956 / 1pr3) TaxID=577650 RepID=A0A7U3YJD8_DESPD|nr:sulfurtransferase-like selenium metabolism protein YedF [Desulfobulbus propionicus]ADW16487.1 selenium metabolism protein YedF [Desulfobulbus propionicus DSM 2032]